MAATIEQKLAVWSTMYSDAANALHYIGRQLEKANSRLSDSDSTTAEQQADGRKVYGKLKPLLNVFLDAQKAMPRVAEFDTWEPTPEQLAQVTGTL